MNWRKVFRKLDVDKSNSIDRKELREAFKILKYDFSDRFIDAAFDQFDNNGDGTLRFDDFVHCLSCIRALTDNFVKAARGKGEIVCDLEQFLKICVAGML